MKLRVFTVLVMGLLLMGQVCFASAVDGVFLYLVNPLSQPVTCEPPVKAELITQAQPQTLPSNDLVFLSTPLVSEVQATPVHSVLEVPRFPSTLREVDILACSVAYHDPPLQIRQAAHLRLDLDAEEWFGIMSEKLPPPPPKNLATALLENYTQQEIMDICNELLSGRHESTKGVFRMGVPEPASCFLLLASVVGLVFWQRRRK